MEMMGVAEGSKGRIVNHQQDSTALPGPGVWFDSLTIHQALEKQLLFVN